METLFTDMDAPSQASASHRSLVPLAVRMRPAHLDDFVGQDEVVGEGSWLKTAISHDALSSLILYGPPGTGKTTLARIIAHTTQAAFVEVSAIGGTVKDLRREIDEAQSRLMSWGRRTILFIDEIHRFNRSQQDALLHAVENRVVVLIGATTENPYFEVNSALLSRSRVVELKALSKDALRAILERALVSPQGLAGRFTLEADALEALIALAGGDARAALVSLELASQLATPEPSAKPVDASVEPSAQPVDASVEPSAGGEDTDVTGDAGAISPDETPTPIAISLKHVRDANPRRGLAYDKAGDMHYDIISAFIKSMRGSDPDAALYWLARMIDAGEDPKFIARRIFILASEDIGNADPQALLVAEAAFRSAEVIGYPECRINLAQAALYMALAPKSNACEKGIDAALAEVRSGPRREVPAHLRDRHRPGSDTYGPYLYPHDDPRGWTEQRYLPEGLERGSFYDGGQRGWELWRAETTARDRLSFDDESMSQ
ncbi:MAG: replication-associated recombination protein A [Atopobiaceae bacterium]|nr:replication-associated recombination protein A [Atopobiaceae bacterium]